MLSNSINYCMNLEYIICRSSRILYQKHIKEFRMDNLSIKVVLLTAILLAAHLPSFSRAINIGVCYGLNGNNLPSPVDVINLYKKSKIGFLRLYEPRLDVLEALRGSGLVVAIGPRNEDLPALASNPEAAATWVKTYICPYINDVLFRWLTLGNEVIPGPFGSYVAQAMINVNNALVAEGIGAVKVTTVLPGNALAASYPPSAGVFSDPATMANVTHILSVIGSPLMINVYPYFAYAADPVHISLDYALFRLDKPVVIDGQYEYYNIFDAMVDAFNAALEKIGYDTVQIAVAETGWPSAGDGGAACIGNAQMYLSKLMVHVMQTGTPRRPKVIMETFIFEMFNENMKPPGTEQNFGFFYPNMQPVFPFW